jgi:hypothetical protein
MTSRATISIFEDVILLQCSQAESLYWTPLFSVLQMLEADLEIGPAGQAAVLLDRQSFPQEKILSLSRKGGA